MPPAGPPRPPPEPPMPPMPPLQWMPPAAGDTAVRPVRPVRPLVPKVPCIPKAWPFEVKQVMLESMCEMVDLRFQIWDGFSEGAYSLTATAIKRKTNMEITYADIKALMDI
ncbi:hypothetical protein B0T24DRAFT_599941 [Lasiosphaeria ovina]|uniref:Uncharacterized protein n=1 Tax=Lasiosphaeria ovina TaxID=92902 RepID=A0AAE0JSS0_9PEZI|nr:hypothetical protein B0T24DRAFT_599941 [Lasiosphaeria ovina]